MDWKGQERRIIGVCFVVVGGLRVFWFVFSNEQVKDPKMTQIKKGCVKSMHRFVSVEVHEDM